MPSQNADASIPSRIEHAVTMLGELAQQQVPLAPLTTYRLGGSAAIMVRPRSVADLHRVAYAIAATSLPVLVLGRGSNVLIADDGFDGIAVTLSEMGVDFSIEGTRVTAAAAVALPQLARRLVAASLAGFEWAVGVPGSVGGAVRMNAGGHGGDMAQCLVEVRLFDLLTNQCAWVKADRLGLRFRGSDLGDHQVVIEARLQLADGNREESERVLNDVVHWRREHQPGGQNAGSVFVNPIPGELAAGELIDRVGLRGFALGSACVSEKHANFIQGSEGGRASDVRDLIQLVRDRVAAETGFVLRSEVRLVGFADTPIDDVPGVQL